MVHSAPSSPVLGLITHLPVGKEGGRTKRSLRERKHQQELLCGWSFGGLGGKRMPLPGDQSRGTMGPVQQLLPPALWHPSLFSLPKPAPQPCRFPGKGACSW